MNVETTINILKDYTDAQLKILASAIAAEQKSRDDDKLKKIVEKACVDLEELDTVLDDTIEVTVSSYGVDFTGYLDLSELCQVLREYIP